MKMRFVTFGRIVDYRRTCRRAGAAIICAAALAMPAAPADGSEQSIPSKSALARPAAVNAPAALQGTAPRALTASLTNVTSAQLDGDLVVSVLTDSPVERTRQLLMSDPPRLILDLVDVFNKLPFFDLRVNHLGVRKVRVRQHSAEPRIVRLVFDLDEGHGDYEIRPGTDSLQVVFRAAGPLTASATRAPAPKPVQPAPQASPVKVHPSVAENPVAKPAAPRLAPRPAPAPAISAKPAETGPSSPATPKAAAPEPKLTAVQQPAPVVPKPAESRAAIPAAARTVPQAAPAAPAKPKEAREAMVETGTAVSQPAATARVSVARAPAVEMPRASAEPQGKQPSGAIPIVREAAAIDLSGSVLLAEAAPAVKPPAAPAPVAAPAPASPARAGGYTGHPLTLDLIDISLVDFFRLMAEEGGINVVMDPEIKGTISIKVVKVPWDQIFEAALANNGLDRQIEGNLVRIARKTTLQEEAKQREALKKATLLAADIETRIKRLNYAKAADFIDALTEQKTVRGTVVVDERSNSLILTDIPSSIERMVQLVDSLDLPQPQVEIEARIVAATRDFARDIGVQFGFVQGNLERVTVGGPNTFGTIGGTRPAATPTNTYAAGNETTGRGASQSTSSQSAGVSTGTSTNKAGNFNVNIPSQRPFGGIGISVGNIFDTFLLDAAITAGESKGLAKLISQPKVTAQNNSPASITQGVRFPVQIVANNTVTVQFQNAALTLTVTPQITYEGNIVLDLKVENNTPDFANAVNGIPSIRTSESSTRVLVTDGGTTVIGGILIDNETTQEDRVPGLASLPIIGNVFRRSMVSHSTQEVLFFITPRVIK